MAIGWIGRQNDGAGNVNKPPAGFKAASRYQNTLGVDLIITKTWGFWGIGGDPAANGKMCVYADSAGSPTTLLQVSNQRTGLSSGWCDFTYAATWTWTAGTVLWLGILTDVVVSNQSEGILTNGVAFNANTYAAGPSNPFGASPFLANFEYRFFAEGYDGAFKLGRIATAESRDGTPPVGVYLKSDPHFEKFVLGGDSAPMGGSTSVTVTGIQVFYINTDAATVRCAIYNNNFTPPDPATDPTRTMLEGCGLIGQSVQVAGVTPGWISYAFSPPLVLVAGTYWLGIVSDADGPHCNVCQWLGHLVDAGASQTPDFTTFPAVIPLWTGVIGMTYPFLINAEPFGISLYADYTPAVAPDQIVFPQIPMMPRSRRQVVAY